MASKAPKTATLEKTFFRKTGMSGKSIFPAYHGPCHGNFAGLENVNKEVDSKPQF